MDRYIKEHILEDSIKKIILISGPRQSGKTTLTRSLYSDAEYFNYDYGDDRVRIDRRHWRRDASCLIFDELHKMNEWKRWLKGIYDVEGLRSKILVTGSANMDTFRQVGDSLAGRYFHYRLHPLDMKEIVNYTTLTHEQAFQSLMQFGGFPEPFLNASESFYKKWQRTHMDVILRQDFLDLYAVKSILKIEILVELLTSRIASPISYANIANDLHVDPKTVQSWLLLLENFYVLFKITPYHHNIARSILKEPKYYFFDIGRALNDGARLENLVGCSLLKEIHYLQDSEGWDVDLFYLRNKDGVELDFLITKDKLPWIAVEVKTSDPQPSKAFLHFKKSTPIKHCIQLVASLEREFDTDDGVSVRHLSKFLSSFDLKTYS